MKQSNQSDKYQLLQDLQSQHAYVRKIAAEKMGDFQASDEQIINALKLVAETDQNKYVRQAAMGTLEKFGVSFEPTIQFTEPENTHPVNQFVNSIRGFNWDGCGCLLSVISLIIEAFWWLFGG